MGEVLALPDSRKARLKELESVIESGWDAAVSVGKALMEIRDDGLYHEVGAVTFEQYCRSRWSLSKSYAYQHIDAAEVALATSGIPDAVPIATEAVGRELVPLLRSEGPDRVAEAWARVSRRIGPGKRPPTARAVHEILVEEGFRASPRFGGPGGGQKNTTILLGEVGDKIVAAENRLNWFLSREVPKAKSIAKSTRTSATQWADRAEEIARKLREFAEGT